MASGEHPRAGREPGSLDPRRRRGRRWRPDWSRRCTPTTWAGRRWTAEIPW